VGEGISGTYDLSLNHRMPPNRAQILPDLNELINVLTMVVLFVCLCRGPLANVRHTSPYVQVKSMKVKRYMNFKLYTLLVAIYPIIILNIFVLNRFDKDCRLFFLYKMENSLL